MCLIGAYERQRVYEGAQPGRDNVVSVQKVRFTGLPNVLHTVLKLLLDPDINDGGSVSYVALFQSKAADVCFNETCVLQLDKGAQPS